VIFEVNLGRLVGMVVGVKMVGVREVGVVRRLFVRARFVVPRCFLVKRRCSMIGRPGYPPRSPNGASPGVGA
jgi:hypothetical protein